jgi:hypothetical protein
VPRNYDVVIVNRVGLTRVHGYTTDDELRPGDVLRLDGRYWLAAQVEPAGDAVEEHHHHHQHHPVEARVLVKPARYRLRLRHPDGREELGAFRRFRADAPRLGHAFTTREAGRPESWEVVDERLAYDEQGEPYLDVVAERDFAEVEGDLPDHELEHALARSEEELPPQAAEAFARAQEAGLAVELVALEPGEAPDWEEAERYLDPIRRFSAPAGKRLRGLRGRERGRLSTAGRRAGRPRARARD